MRVRRSGPIGAICLLLLAVTACRPSGTAGETAGEGGDGLRIDAPGDRSPTLYHGEERLADCSGFCDVSPTGRFALYVREHDVLMFDARQRDTTVVASVDPGAPRAAVWDVDDGAVWLVRDRRCSMIEIP